MASSEVKIVADNTDAVLKALRTQIQAGLEECGIVAEGYAKQKCPVDTGNLRNSITHQYAASEKAEYIGTDVEYAPYVELGTYKAKAQPYLRPAATDHAAEYQNIIKKHLQS